MIRNAVIDRDVVQFNSEYFIVSYRDLSLVVPQHNSKITYMIKQQLKEAHYL